MSLLWHLSAAPKLKWLRPADKRAVRRDGLGNYEYVIDANDESGGVYFYDFASGGFFYTSPGFPFPYLYDFHLKPVLSYGPPI